MDMILEKKDIVQTALHLLKEKIVPAALEYAEESTGKATTYFLKSQSDFEGMNMYIRDFHIIYSTNVAMEETVTAIIMGDQLYSVITYEGAQKSI